MALNTNMRGTITGGGITNANDVQQLMTKGWRFGPL
jgi:hypothetical protein